ncbi:MAG: YbjQ family protein [Cellulosilyticaceae bacterium]
MLVVNIDYIPDKELKILGLVKGSTVQANLLGKGLSSTQQAFTDTDTANYASMLADARKVATEFMVKKAEALRADAIINVRFETNSVMSGTCEEILVYGTAVKYRVRDDLQQF